MIIEAMATEKQIGYVNVLALKTDRMIEEAEARGMERAVDMRSAFNDVTVAITRHETDGTLTKGEASNVIDYMVKFQKRVHDMLQEWDLTHSRPMWPTRSSSRGEAPLTATKSRLIVTAAPPEEGMYRTLDGVIYKVQKAVHGSGHLYAKKLVVEREPDRADDGTITEPAKVRFDYVPGAIARLKPTDRMSIEDAKAFGVLYGTCVRCGRTLTREDSIERAMGPVCASKI